MPKYILPGSERKPLAGACLTGPANPEEQLEVTLILRRNADAVLQERVNRVCEGDRAMAPLTREEFLTQFGATAEDIDAVSKFAAVNHLIVVSVSRERCTVILSGAVKDFEQAFDVKLQRYEDPSGAYRSREGQITLPDSLKAIVQAVLGLDNRPQARAELR